ncbi:MAG TPA: polymer-forming cytoskeletal protein [Candidatus Acidoferrales bacterium]|nr:polymer-forming cytoskeletal protein [Candidatus Acidoferrales bacterium]
MSPHLAAAVLCAVTGVLLVLPMLPAILELRLKKDAAPLNVVQQYAGEIAHFAHGFRDSVQRMAPLVANCAATGVNAHPTLKGGDACLVLGKNDATALSSPTGKEPTCALVVIAAADLTLPDRTAFLKEIYAAGKLTGGEECAYRAIYGEGDIVLGRASKLMRWVHAAGALHAEPDCDLYGRVSSDREIMLGAGCVFQRLHAPRIVIGTADGGAAEACASPRLADVGGREKMDALEPRRVIEGDFEVQPGEVVAGNVVARGKVRVGAGAILLGSLKSGKALVIESGVQARGSVISGDRMRIGEGCRIHGPVIAERGIEIAAGTRCGEVNALTSVCALKIRVEEGVTVFGTLWAREIGHAGRGA